MLEEQGRRQLQREPVVQRIGELGEADRIETVLGQLDIRGEIVQPDLQLRRDHAHQRVQHRRAQRTAIDRGDRRLLEDWRLRYVEQAAAQPCGIAGRDQQPRLISGQRGMDRRQPVRRVQRHQPGGAGHQPLAGRVHLHAAIAPERPGDGDGAALAGTGGAACLARLRETVEEGVGGGVIGLPRIAERAGQRGEQQEEIERFRADGAVEMERARQLRRQHLGQTFWRLADQRLVAQQSGGLDHAIQPAMLAPDGGDQRRNRVRVGQIDRLEADILRQDRVGRAAARQHDAGRRRMGADIVSQQAAQRARPAGDQIDAVVAP